MTDEHAPPPSPEGEARRWEHLARYVAGAADPAERDAIEARVASDAALRADYERMRLIWERTGEALDLSVSEEDVERSWRRLVVAMDAEAIPGRRRPRAGPHAASMLSRSWRRAAISVAAAGALGLGAWFLVSRAAPDHPTGGSAVRELATAAGERLSVDLVDGTHVVLAPDSRLRVLPGFDENAREVSLDGRAYFRVRHDSTRPFLVHAGNVVTRVLGTEFEVDAYPGAADVSVVVRSGRVGVRPASIPEARARTLGRAEEGVVSPDGAVRVRAGVDVDVLLAWTTGTLAFRSTPLAEAADELERWYGIEVGITDEALGERRITATFRSESLDVILSTVGELVDARVERRGKQVVFSPLPSR